MNISLARFQRNVSSRSNAAPVAIIGTLSIALFGLFYMAALNNPILIHAPKAPVAAAAAAPVIQPQVEAVRAPEPKVEPPPAPDLSRPLTRAELREVQNLLRSAGYDPGKPDGLMGPKTKTAIVSFEATQGIEPSAQPNLELLEALRTKSR
jgi:peptidoglycan hydrolase-like protein with peptidoglycan-binding domain